MGVVEAAVEDGCHLGVHPVHRRGENHDHAQSKYALTPPSAPIEHHAAGMVTTCSCTAKRAEAEPDQRAGDEGADSMMVRASR
jgi:hypothetical protein